MPFSRLLVLALLAGLTGWVAIFARMADAAEAPLLIAITGTVVSFSAPNERGELAGFNVDMAHAICQRLKRECRFDVRKFPEILPQVAAGKADIGMGNYLKTPERERQVLFSQRYWRSTSSFLGAKTIKLPSLELIPQQHRLCVTAGSKQIAFLQTLATLQPDAIVTSTSNQDAIDKLNEKRCSLLLVPTMQGLTFLQSPAGQGYAFLGSPLVQDGLGGDVHIIVKPGAQELLRQLDAALKDLLDDGTHERLTRKYFPFSIL